MRLLISTARVPPSWGIRLVIGMKPRRSVTTFTPCSIICPNDKKKVIVVSGPTGVGKSRLALDLAKRLNGEIISADSVQIYRGLDVGSAKPSFSDQREVPHHLISVLDPSEEYSVGQFFEDARNATNEVLNKGKVPVVIGGTGLYLRWFIYGRPNVPKVSQEIVSKVFSEIQPFQEKGEWDEAVQLVMNAGDPKARALPSKNWYRLRRSLEIIRSTGHPPSAFTVPYDSFKLQTSFKHKNLEYDFICLFLTRPRVDLYRNIDLRCEEMLRDVSGLLSEASWLLNIGLQPNMNSATRAIGYRQAMEYLLKCREDGGRSAADSFNEFLGEFQKATRNYAKRQACWFRNELIYQWVDASKPLESLIDFICSSYKDKMENIMVPQHLLLKKDLREGPERYDLKSYRTKNLIFKNESDCNHILEWVWRTQQKLTL